MSRPKTIGLTKRQTEIMDLVKLGYTNKSIAYALGISVHSVKYMLKRYIYKKFDAVDRANAVYICLKKGFIDFDPD